MTWSPEAYEAVLDELEDREPFLMEKLVEAIEGSWDEHEESAIRFLLDGLGVASIEELARLVNDGRIIQRLVGSTLESLAGVPFN